MKKQREGGFLIAKIHQLSGRIFTRLLKTHSINDINPAQGRILFVLWENDGIPITELSKKTQLEKSTLTNMLDRLEQDGFIIRKPSPGDRRKIIIERTEKDRSMQASYSSASEEMLKIFYRDFTAKETDQFEHYLRKILSNLIEHDKGGTR